MIMRLSKKSQVLFEGSPRALRERLSNVLGFSFRFSVKKDRGFVSKRK
ncbi:MAG: hypothetical protein JXR56_05435 [Candidatus Cloacimonetes bacterium]|nr:hypothetical protein [Candidatus Cloacimonadota bacterium]